MSVTNLHPMFVIRYPPLFRTLLRTYMEPGIDYWLDMPADQGRVRLTNVLTGEYIIYGALGARAMERDVGLDEQLFMNVPQGMLRVKVGPYTFRHLEIRNDLAYRGCAQRWCIYAVPDGSGVSFDFSKFDLSDINSIRELQYKRLSDHYLAS